MNIIIDLEPVPKGVPRTRYVKELGKTITYYHWKTIEALDNIKAILQTMNLESFQKHVPVKMTVTFWRTKSKWLKKKEKLPFRKPDLDNFLKCTIDGINGILVADDAQITAITARKRWSPNNHGYIEIELEEDTIDA